MQRVHRIAEDSPIKRLKLLLLKTAEAITNYEVLLIAQ